MMWYSLVLGLRAGQVELLNKEALKIITLSLNSSYVWTLILEGPIFIYTELY